MNRFTQRILMSGLVMLATAQPVLAQQTERVPALREKVYSQLARAQSAADEQGSAAGLAALQSVADRAHSMNSYERAMLWNFYGFMHYDNGNTREAIDYFAKVVKEQPIPESLRKNTLFSLAQLALTDGQYQASLNYIDDWQQLSEIDERAKAWVLKSQAYYQLGDYEEALAPIKNAIEASEANGDIPKENWFVLARAIHYELGQTDGVAAMLEKLVVNYSQSEYWLQLAGVYGQLEQNAKQLAVLEAAHQQGFISKASDLRNLAQVYYLNKLPFKAAKIMQQGLSNKVLANNLSNRKFYAQSLTQAQEIEQAIDAYQQAAELGERGEMLAQAAQLAVNHDNNSLAITLAQRALAAGDLKSPGNMYLAKGMALVNQQKYQQALAEFTTASGYSGVQSAAQQWANYARSQQRYQEQLAATAH